MSLGNMRALALSSETAKYMFLRTACQCVSRTSCLFRQMIWAGSHRFLCPRADISHNPTGHQTSGCATGLRQARRDKAATDLRFRSIGVGNSRNSMHRVLRLFFLNVTLLILLTTASFADLQLPQQ